MPHAQFDIVRACIRRGTEDTERTARPEYPVYLGDVEAGGRDWRWVNWVLCDACAHVPPLRRVAVGYDVVRHMQVRCHGCARMQRASLGLRATTAQEACAEGIGLPLASPPTARGRGLSVVVRRPGMHTAATYLTRLPIL